MAIKAAYENLLILPRGVLETIAEYHAPVTNEVLIKHTKYGKMHTAGNCVTLRFNYSLLAGDLEEFLRFGEGVGIATKVDQIIRVFALTQFTLFYQRESYSEAVAGKCSNKLCSDLKAMMASEACSVAFRAYLRSASSSSQDEKDDAYPKVHAVLFRLGVMTAVDKNGRSELVEQEKGTSPKVSLQQEQVASESSGTRFISNRRGFRRREDSLETQ